MQENEEIRKNYKEIKEGKDYYCKNRIIKST